MNVLLRPVEEADLPILFAHQADPEAWRMAAFPPRDRDAFFAHWRRILADPATTARTVLAEGEVAQDVAGYVASWSAEGKRLVGYWIGREHWGRGIASRALAAFAAGVERTRPLHAYVAKTNPASIRVLERCGFERIAERTAEDGVAELEYALR